MKHLSLLFALLLSNFLGAQSAPIVPQAIFHHEVYNLRLGLVDSQGIDVKPRLPKSPILMFDAKDSLLYQDFGAAMLGLLLSVYEGYAGQDLNGQLVGRYTKLPLQQLIVFSADGNTLLEVDNDFSSTFLFAIPHNTPYLIVETIHATAVQYWRVPFAQSMMVGF